MISKAAMKRLEDGTGQVRDVRNLLVDYKTAVEGLHGIACWSQGSKVSGTFDEPGSAAAARETLTAMGIGEP